MLVGLRQNGGFKAYFHISVEERGGGGGGGGLLVCTISNTLAAGHVQR